MNPRDSHWDRVAVTFGSADGVVGRGAVAFSTPSPPDRTIMTTPSADQTGSNVWLNPKWAVKCSDRSNTAGGFSHFRRIRLTRRGLKTVLAGIILFGFSALLQVTSSAPLDAEPGAPGSASELCSIHFGEHGDGVGSFVFDVAQGTKTTGSFTFAAEEHHNYPDVLFAWMKSMTPCSPGGSSGSSETEHYMTPLYSSLCLLVTAREPGSPDWFAIQCTNGEGEVVFKARGDLFIGDVVLGEADEGVSRAEPIKSSPIP